MKVRVDSLPLPFLLSVDGWGRDWNGKVGISESLQFAGIKIEAA